MASLYTKFLDFIGIEESDEPEDERAGDGYYRDEAPERPAGVFGGGRAQASSNRRNDRAGWQDRCWCCGNSNPCLRGIPNPGDHRGGEGQKGHPGG